DDHALDDVLELSDIAWIPIARHALECVVAQAEVVAPEKLRVATHEVPSEEGNLFRSLAQGRHDDLDHVQPIVEVVAEASGRHGLLQVLVGGGQDPHVDLDGGAPSHAGELAILEDMQELALEGRMQIADLVEEDRAVVGRLELAELELMGAREGAALVTEEFAFQELAWHGGAIDLHEGTGLANAELVNGSSGQILAGARLPA